MADGQLYKVYYSKYSKTSYSISNVDLIININIYQLLLNNDYKLINWAQSDLIFVRNDSEV